MIEVEGYKAFIGTMKIAPKNTAFPVREIKGQWLYKPEFDCWYCDGHSYSANICEVVDDKTVSVTYTCVNCGKPVDYRYGICKDCIAEAGKAREEYIHHVQNI